MPRSALDPAPLLWVTQSWCRSATHGGWASEATPSGTASWGSKHTEPTQLGGAEPGPPGPSGSPSFPGAQPATWPATLGQIPPEERTPGFWGPGHCWLALLEGRSRGETQGLLAWRRRAVCHTVPKTGPVLAVTAASPVVPGPCQALH